MGNKLCKRKTDVVDNNSRCRSPTPFDKIINRLHLRPNAWKSDSQLNQKQSKSCAKSSVDPGDKQDSILRIQPLSKSSDWTEVQLEVPEKEHIHLPNPKLALIFNKDSENGTPIPPPRKHKPNLREKIEAVAKSSLQAFQSKKPVEEPLCVQKKINYKCPHCDQDENNHNRDHHHHHHNHKHENGGKPREENKEELRKIIFKKEKDGKRKKNLSVVSLPNYDELKLTVANFDNIDKDPSHLKSNGVHRTSDTSLPTDQKKQKTTLDSYITRCRSFGSLLPQQLKKMRSHKTPVDIESDDSFGGLEDWDLGLIEHYNPKDTSLPRPRKTPLRNSGEILADIESMVVKEEDIPHPPERKSESLVKKINRDAAQQSAQLERNCEKMKGTESQKMPTPPPSPLPNKQEISFPTNLPTQENGHVEHSSLMKILERFSVMDKKNLNDAKTNDETNIKAAESSTDSSLTPSLLEFEKNIAVNSVEEFISAEKLNTDKNCNLKNGVVS